MEAGPAWRRRRKVQPSAPVLRLGAEMALRHRLETGPGWRRQTKAASHGVRGNYIRGLHLRGYDEHER